MALLRAVAAGETAPEEAFEALRALPVRELAHVQATLDTHRSLRTGVPEVILGEGKTAAQIVEIVAALAEGEVPVLVTRLDAEKAKAVVSAFDEPSYDPISRTLVVGACHAPAPKGRPVVVVSAGTSDAPVAEEAAVTARLWGARVERIHDVGVAGLHRLTPHLRRLQSAGVVVVCAGMEGALPSVVAGLTGRPVVGVPTSVGYGASFGGVAALLGMLCSCASGVAVVNIDNGFGAGHLAATIARELPEESA